MLTYRAPLRDIQFVLDELLDAPAHYAKLQGCEEVTPDLLAAIIDSGAKFAGHGSGAGSRTAGDSH